MQILVTGAAGFVGSRLASVLASRGHQVTGTFINKAPELRGVVFEEVDLFDRLGLRRVVEQYNPEVVIHLAGLTHVGESWKNPDEYFQVNVLGTENVLQTVGQRRLVFASSAEVYGIVPDDRQPIAEDSPLAPRSPYALTKAAAERLVLLSNATVVRSFNILGPGQAPSFALPAFAQQLRTIQNGDCDAVLRVGNLSASRDFLHLADAIEGYCAVIERGEPGTCYNLGSGTAVSMREMLDRLLRITGVAAQIEVESSRLRSVDIPLLCADNGRLRALKWEPQRTIEDALEELWHSTAGGAGLTD